MIINNRGILRIIIVTITIAVKERIFCVLKNIVQCYDVLPVRCTAVKNAIPWDIKSNGEDTHFRGCVRSHCCRVSLSADNIYFVRKYDSKSHTFN